MHDYYKDHVVSDTAKQILEGAWDLHVHCSPAPNPADVNGGLDGFVLNDFELLPEVYEVIEVARDHNIALATGHMSWLECIALFKAAKKMGLKKTIFTHVDWRSCQLTIAQQKELADLGVYMEKSFYEFDKQRALMSFNEIDAKHFILSSDMGMFPDLRHVKGFACEIDEYLDGGISVEDLMVMTHDNPEFLMEG